MKIGTVFSHIGTKALLCGSGELGKEVAIELQRYGVEVVAIDRYPNAPAMQVAHKSHVLSMLDGEKLKEAIIAEHPDYIIPEVEAIATDTLVALEKEGYKVIPTANATRLTMNREGIRRLAAEELGVKTSKYRFAETEEEFRQAVNEIGIPCVVKPVMSSSGHGQSMIKTEADIKNAWKIAQEEGRSGAGRVIVEEFIDFDYEITPHKRNDIPPPDRTPTRKRRLPRIVATTPDEHKSNRKSAGNSRQNNSSTRRTRHIRSRTLRKGRRRDIQRSLPASPRYRNGNDDFTGHVGIRATRPRHTRSPHTLNTLLRSRSIKSNSNRRRQQHGRNRQSAGSTRRTRRTNTHIRQARSKRASPLRSNPRACRHRRRSKSQSRKSIRETGHPHSSARITANRTFVQQKTERLHLRQSLRFCFKLQKHTTKIREYG